MGGGTHLQRSENASFQVRRRTASLPWEDCWELEESRENGDNGPVTGFNSVEYKEEQTVSEDSSCISAEHSDKASRRQTAIAGRMDADAYLAQTSVENSTEPEESPNVAKSGKSITQPPVVTDKEKWRPAMEMKILQQQRKLRNSNLDKRIQDLREEVLRYSPGHWLIETGGVKRQGYDIPKVTTLLLVGPMGAGKSTLINNMIRVVNNKASDFDRAQALGDLAENGTSFLHEHMLCEGSERICVYDSRGLSEVDTDDALKTLKRWMEMGVSHGQVVVRDSDSNATKRSLESKARHGHSKVSKKRTVNFVIYVVNAVSLDSMRTREDSASQSNLVTQIKSPFLSFRDDRPVVVMTHGDELSTANRIRAKMFLSKMIGLSPADQVFDIPGFTGRDVDEGDIDACDDFAILDMLVYALKRADRNLPYKQPTLLRKVAFYTGAFAVKDLFVYCCRMIWQTIRGALNSPNPSLVEITILVLTAVWTVAFLLLLLLLIMR